MSDLKRFDPAMISDPYHDDYAGMEEESGGEAHAPFYPGAHEALGRLDFAELSDARWFSRDEVRRALSGQGGDLVVPPPFAIAHHLIRAWADADG